MAAMDLNPSEKFRNSLFPARNAALIVLRRAQTR
jgi:hypothetical protein